MAISYDRVMVTPVDFNIFKYNYNSDPYRFEYNIGMDTRNPHAALPAYLNSSVFHKMLALGYNHLDLRDTYGVIIGSLDISGNYDIKYVAAVTELVGATHYSDKAYDATSYPNYPEGYTWGMKYKAAIPDLYDPLWFSVTLNGEVIERRMIDDEEIILEIGDYFSNDGDFPIEFMWNMASRYSYSICIQTRTYHGVTHDYLVLSTFSWYEDSHNNESLEYASIFLDSTFYENHICDGLSLEDFIIPEEGFMNEIDNRYSPRGASNIIGMYVFDEATMHDVAKGLINFGFYEWVSQFFGGDFKDCVMYLNFFHGLHDQIAAHIDGNSDIKAADKFLRTSSDPVDTINSDSVDTEFVEWKTPIGLRITPHFNDYRDYLCSYQLFLPYYGFINLNPNDAVNAVIKIYYNINICTRAAMITVTTNSTRTSGLETKIFTVATSVGEEIPYGKNAIQSMWLGMAQVVGKAVATGASIGTSMGSAHFASGANLRGLQSGLSEAQDMASRAREAVGNNKFAAEMYEGQAAKIQDEINAKQKSNVITATSLNNAHSIVSGIPTPSVDHSTSSNGGNSETGTMDELHPYVLITRPVSAEPADYESYVGTPSTESVTLSSCTGFTQVAAVKPESMANAPKYVNEIISLLQAGVYL